MPTPTQHLGPTGPDGSNYGPEHAADVKAAQLLAALACVGPAQRVAILAGLTARYCPHYGDEQPAHACQRCQYDNDE